MAGGGWCDAVQVGMWVASAVLCEWGGDGDACWCVLPRAGVSCSSVGGPNRSVNMQLKSNPTDQQMLLVTCLKLFGLRLAGADEVTWSLMLSVE
ncbi:hypothetical protein COO60DRAFT_1534340 [Scenedesmus sp. NREL 46B-D3]|nr:hypothetical protein COO60DRAFT_1534340 [Scenedesmus sp. NREL 46B-D3]